MLRKLLGLGLFMLCVPAALAAPALVPRPPALAAASWILIEAKTGTVLVEHEADTPLPPASLTKMMTDYVVASELAAGRATLDDLVPISEKAWRMDGSKMFVRVGASVRLEDLLRGVVIQSGNDASVALAEYLAGDEAAFSDVMNRQAALLGMKNSRFRNATGMPAEDHLSTARDLSILARRLIEDHPDHYRYYSEKTFTYGEDFSTGQPITQRNRNELLWIDDSVDGIKTGYTAAAGYCLVASSERDGMRLISVVLGTNSPDARTQETQKLLRYGFRYFESQPLLAGGEALGTAPIWKGTRSTVAYGLAEDIRLTLPRGTHEGLETRTTLREPLTAPLIQGDAVGAVQVVQGDEVLYEAPLLALHEVEEAGWFKRFLDALRLWFASLFG